MQHEHDFKRFPELTNRQMEMFYFDSPHRQITENFRTEVVKVTDGDTIRVLWNERDFNFPIRLANLAAPELEEVGGKESKDWLSDQILGAEVDLILTEARVEKWGRILAYVLFNGVSLSEESIRNFHAIAWDDRVISEFTNLNEELKAIENDFTTKV